MLTAALLALAPLAPPASAPTVPSTTVTTFRIDNPQTQVLTLPAAGPGLQWVRVDCALKVYWEYGVEIMSGPPGGHAAVCWSWYAPNHGGQPFPSRSDLGTDGDSTWDISVVMPNGTVGGSVSHNMMVDVCRNSLGNIPVAPHDGVIDGDGPSGGTHAELDPLKTEIGQVITEPSVLAALTNGANVDFYSTTTLLPSISYTPGVNMWLLSNGNTKAGALVTVTYGY